MNTLLENINAEAGMSEKAVYTEDIRQLMRRRTGGRPYRALVRTYGCQQNVSDGEKIKGMLSQMGFSFTQEEKEADFIIFNTCAVREHAQDRVFGNIGVLKSLREKNPNLLIAVCGCMMEQEQVAEKIKSSYPFVNIVFGTHVLHLLPQIMFSALSQEKRVFLRGGESKEIYEGLPVKREKGARAWVTAMYGCDNFCAYCIVPYVRGREKSRHPDDIYAEVSGLIKEGYKEITLLGQNVNSYGKGLSVDINFAGLLKRLDSIEGDFWIRFMTSHPKDASKELFDTMAQSKHIPHYIHLPVQSGNDTVLRRMNRGYTSGEYLSLVEYARRVMPDICFTTDIIVGFPEETYEQFEDTLSLIEKVKYTSIFSFIYSKRPGTRAAEFDDPVGHKEKTQWFAQLMQAQERVAKWRGENSAGKVHRVLVEGRSPKSGLLTGRTEGFVMVEFPGEDRLIGQFVTLEIVRAEKWSLWGEIIAEG